MDLTDSIGDQERPLARKSWVGVVLGVWLSGVFAASLFSRLDAETNRSLGAFLLASALVWPVGYYMLSRCRVFAQPLSLGSFLALIIFGLFCGLSAFGSSAPIESIGYTALTLIACWVVMQFNADLDEHQLETGLKTYALLMVILLVGFALYDYVPGERLGNGKRILNPNTVGLVAMSVFLAALALRLLVVRLIVMGAVGWVIVLTGSRTAAVGSLAGLAVTLWLRGRTARVRMIATSTGTLAAGVLVAVLYSDAVLKGLEQFFALHDQYRGFDSGATGRVAAWEATWKLFQSHPWLGVGFRTHEHILKAETSSHNGYLALLAEVGLVGFSAALYLACSGLFRIWRRLRDLAHLHSASILFGLGCAYLALAGFERYYINVGNPTSLLFLLCLLTPRIVGPRQSNAQAAESEFGVPHDVAFDLPRPSSIGAGPARRRGQGGRSDAVMGRLGASL
jgi:O-antigen ligase